MSVVESRSGSSPLPGGLTLDDILRADKRRPPLPRSGAAPSPGRRSQSNRTLLDIIREEHKQGQRDKTTWKTFRDLLRLKRAGASWTSSVTETAPWTSSDAVAAVAEASSGGQRFNSLGALLSNSAQEAAHSEDSGRMLSRSTHHDEPAGVSIPGDRLVVSSSRPEISRHNSTWLDDDDEPVALEGRVRLGVALAEERALSAREESMATQDTVAMTNAATTAAREETETNQQVIATLPEQQPSRLSLMELLEENDRQVSLVGARYILDDLDHDEEGGDDTISEIGGGVASELNCCVCMVRNKGAAFIPCGHTFCRLCSRELWVQRGNCPLCNSFIVEILDIF